MNRVIERRVCSHLMSRNKHYSSNKNHPANAATVAASLPSRPKDAVAYICEAFATWQQHQDPSEPLGAYAEYMGYFALLNMYLESMQLNLPAPELNGNKEHDIQCIATFFTAVRQQLAQMTLDLSLLANLNQVESEPGSARFHKITAVENQRLASIAQALHEWLAGAELAEAARDLLSEKFTIIQEQLSHEVLDLDLGWRYISQFSVTLDALESDKKPATNLLQQFSGELWRVQAREEKLPDSTLKSILMKLTDPARWEQESAASRRDT